MGRAKDARPNDQEVLVHPSEAYPSHQSPCCRKARPMMLKHKIRTSLYHPVPHRKRCCSVPQPITRQLLVANTARGVNKRSSRSLHPSSSSSTDLPPKAFLGIPTSSLANLCIRLLTIHGIHRFFIVLPSLEPTDGVGGFRKCRHEWYLLERNGPTPNLFF